jgi:hypothetical protein
MKTVIPSGVNIERKWHIVDAEEAVLGRLASKAAHILMGKHKATYTPFIDMGDHVIVVNAEKVKLTGAKEEQKLYRAHSGYPGGLRRSECAQGARDAPGAHGGRRDSGNASEEQARQADVPEAAGLRGSAAPARGAEARGSGGSVTGEGLLSGSISATSRYRPPQTRGGAGVSASRQRQDHGQRARVRKLFPESRRRGRSSSSRCWRRRRWTSSTS